MSKVAVEERRAGLSRRWRQSLVEIKIIYGPHKSSTIASLVQRSGCILNILFTGVYKIIPSDNLRATVLNKS